MSEELNPNGIISLFQRSKLKYGESDKFLKDEPFKEIMKQFTKTKLLEKRRVEENLGSFKLPAKDDENTEDYFKTTLPQYNSKLHKVLSRCASKKTHDDIASFSHTDGVFCIHFG